MASVSAEVSSTSHSLAEQSSEQAASLGATASSLEEMGSMTKQNADIALMGVVGRKNHGGTKHKSPVENPLALVKESAGLASENAVDSKDMVALIVHGPHE